ncbi:glutamine amidotransferase-related protein [Methanospirillum stamsii]|uniref:Glutamine amidotransferase domain-containing protein n=1 Tax=Methanospirillum stamsii TaxID=1277351 RepID=A0A2V2MWX3_9EURY|nr:hypothetical protein [Methanospirillum stamsii]PWR70765.1 hypothetical protein DLD82_14815 [Methanospirillum stamsii]
MILVIDLTRPDLPILFDEFVSPIIRIVNNLGSKVSTIHLSDLKTIDRNVTGIIIAGTALADTWYQSHAPTSFLCNEKIPVLGICAGMQMITAGKRGEYIPSLEIGMVPVKLTKAGRTDPLTKGKEDFSGYALHQYTTTIKPSWDVLAVSDTGPQIIKCRDAPQYGALFHPEVRNEWIYERFLLITQKTIP